MLSLSLNSLPLAKVAVQVNNQISIVQARKHLVSTLSAVHNTTG